MAPVDVVDDNDGTPVCRTQTQDVASADKWF